MVKATLRPLYPSGKTRYSLYGGLGGPQGRSGRVRKISPPNGIRSPDLPVLSESLYRLSYRGPPLPLVPNIILQAKAQVSVVLPLETEIFKFQFLFVLLKPVLLAKASLTASKQARRLLHMSRFDRWLSQTFFPNRRANSYRGTLLF